MTAPEKRGNRAEQNSQVFAQRPFLDVLDVKFYHLIKGKLVAPAHLPKPGDPGQGSKPSAMPVLIEFKLV